MVLGRTETIIKYYNLIADADAQSIEEIPERQCRVLSFMPIEEMQQALAVDFIVTKKHRYGRPTLLSIFPKVPENKMLLICRYFGKS